MKKTFNIFYIIYAAFIVIFPSLLFHLHNQLQLKASLCELIIDCFMITVVIVGIVQILINNKSKFGLILSLMILIIFVLLPQLYLWRSQNRGFYYLRIIYRFALLYITLFAIPLEIHLSRNEICILIGVFCVFGFVCCIYELIQHPDIRDAMRFFTGRNTRVESFFEQRNRFAAYLALWIILCIFAIELSKSKLWLIPAIFFLFFLVCTGSRASSAMVAIFCLGYLISYRKRLGNINLLMILADIIIIICIILVIPPTRKFLISQIRLESGISGRKAIWTESLNYYMESNPLIGHGLGTQIEKIMTERLRHNVNAHNMYLYLLICGGIMLIMFYCLSFVILLRRGRYHHYLIPFLVSFLFYGFFEIASSPFDYFHLSNMFTICLFFIPSALSHNNKPHQK